MKPPWRAQPPGAPPVDGPYAVLPNMSWCGGWKGTRFDSPAGITDWETTVLSGGEETALSVALGATADQAAAPNPFPGIKVYLLSPYEAADVTSITIHASVYTDVLGAWYDVYIANYDTTSWEFVKTLSKLANPGVPEYIVCDEEIVANCWKYVDGAKQILLLVCCNSMGTQDLAAGHEYVIVDNT